MSSAPGSMPPEQISPSSSCGGSGVRSSIAASVEALGAAVISAVTARVIALHLVAPEVRATGTDAEGAAVLERACRDALEELSRLGDVPEDARRLAGVDPGMPEAGDSGADAVAGG